jgi:uncharacterized protein YjbI with pentapeptide repeats
VAKRQPQAAGEVNAPSIWWWTAFLLAYTLLAAVGVWLLPSLLVDASIERGALATAPEQGAGQLTVAERTAAITAARQVVLLGAGGVLAVITLALTQRRDAITRARHEIERDANRTTRFTEAVKQLGDDKAAVRFGGIYALGRIAEDSDRDRRTIMQILLAYIREAAPYPIPGPTFRGVDDDGARREHDERLLHISTAKAAAEVMGRLSRGLRGEPPRVELFRISLATVDLAEAELDDAHFDGADLMGANLRFASANNASFLGAVITGADFSGAQGYKAVFSRGYGEHANFTEASLRGAYFGGGNFAQASFDGAQLAGAHFVGANLVGASFTGADLRGADLRAIATRDETRSATFAGADLRGVSYDGDISQLGDMRDARLGPLNGPRL